MNSPTTNAQQQKQSRFQLPVSDNGVSPLFPTSSIQSRQREGPESSLVCSKNFDTSEQCSDQASTASNRVTGKYQREPYSSERGLRYGPWTGAFNGSVAPCRDSAGDNACQDDMPIGRVSRTNSFKPTPMSRGSMDDTFANAEDELLRPSEVDKKLRDVILERFPSTSHYVYVLNAPAYFKERKMVERVKIGHSGDVEKRIQDIERTCGITGLKQVHDQDGIAIPYYMRLENLVHTELRNFRKPLQCGKEKCRNKSGHSEWYEVNEKVALESVKLWRNFLKKDPYDANGVLKSEWSRILLEETFVNAMSENVNEAWNDHEKRRRRWNTLLGLTDDVPGSTRNYATG
ncbi:hypothetical protein K432DRAFT_442248 [Lepidopterella palustris CBS 459.81]|uniref:Bacteriophage T5 Orf172 DNA-binding domain-containing protein n=1 Tax=Lepidopterella palustris CBS 459.81 TaxID=1314670 RepID=A0A8E2ED45_9PEZI|nr:hypothetical protein K432DRAFT_442248 [Lepidopterella palustris CBS 459.81]